MTTVTVEEAQANFGDLIRQLQPGEELLITQDDRPVARLVPEPARTSKARRPGSAAGRLEILSEDDEHLEDFREYMP